MEFITKRILVENLNEKINQLAKIIGKFKTNKELVKKYKKWIMQNHPDKGGDTDLTSIVTSLYGTIEKLHVEDFLESERKKEPEFTRASTFNDKRYIVTCTLQEMIDKVEFDLDGIKANFPGYFTPYSVYSFKDNSMMVEFDCTDNTYNGFTLIPNFEGMATTFSPYDVSTNSVVDYLGNEHNNITPLFEDDHCVIYKDLGIPLIQVITGKLIKSVLLVEKK